MFAYNSIQDRVKMYQYQQQNIAKDENTLLQNFANSDLIIGNAAPNIGQIHDLSEIEHLNEYTGDDNHFVKAESRVGNS